ncbi:hypothetical protein YYE_03993 [Plasmodium vinckei vinckei]|uniref:CIR protein PIR protein n=1 Tax=Plasmodium vinckei vinckei TaxID=54757 RepID=A0A081IBA2_PLAVN|nr:hypothetical protein YYE_03993 [Plasmodium vinckei vinckei]
MEHKQLYKTDYSNNSIFCINVSYIHMAKYKEISTIDGYFWEKKEKDSLVEHADGSIIRYCPYSDTGGYNICLNYLQKASSGVINLLEELKKYNLEYDKLAEYAILFLSYKLNQHSKYSGTNLNDFYTDHIKNNKYYNNKINGYYGPTFKDIIDRKKDLMNTNEMYKFNDPFKILFSFYNEINKNNQSCISCSTKANEFVKNFKELNEDYNIVGNTSYRGILSTLSDDYYNFKSYCAENCNGCNDLPTLPKIKTPLTILIPVISKFSVISLFLGVAYKVNNNKYILFLVYFIIIHKIYI